MPTPKTICGECPAEARGCLIMFIKVLRENCPCRTCLIKSMCRVLCFKREDIFIELPHSIRNLLEEVRHYHYYNGDKEYRSLMKELSIQIERCDIGVEYEQY